MHEVSIARTILSEVVASAAVNDVARIGSITLRIGRLSGVVEEALRFGFEMVSVGSPAEGAELIFENEPVVVWCPDGQHRVELEGVRFFCDTHHVACSELLSGRQLELVSYSIAGDQAAVESARVGER